MSKEALRGWLRKTASPLILHPTLRCLGSMALLNRSQGKSLTLQPAPGSSAESHLTARVCPLGLDYLPVGVHLPPRWSAAARQVSERIAACVRVLVSDARVRDLAGPDRPVCLLDKGFHGEFLRRNLARQLPDCRLTYYNYFYPMVRGNGAEENFTDHDYACVVVLSHPSEYHRIARYVRQRFRGSPPIVLPFARAGDAAEIDVSFGTQEPFVVLEFPGAGSKRFQPVWHGLMEAFQRPQLAFTEPFFNSRFIHQCDPQGDLRKPEFGNERLSFADFEAYYEGFIRGLDYFQWLEFHQPVSTAWLGSLSTRKIVYLYRDPRDIYTTWYHRYTFDAVREDFAEFQSLSVEDAYLRLFQGMDYIHSRRGYCFKMPSLQWMASNFAEISSHPNIFGLKYEDIRYRPEEAYTRLLAWLGLDDVGLIPSPGQLLAQEIPKGTFQFQSGGRKTEGGPEARKIYRPNAQMVTHNLRKGVAGDWKNHFTPAVKDKVKELAGEALIRMGYETDLNW